MLRVIRNIMTALTCRDFCYIFCCPPWPSSIASKLAFIPPDPTTYTISAVNDLTFNLHLTERAEFQYSQKELDCIEVMKVKTKRGYRIATMYVRCGDPGCANILFSHGNAVDLGQMSSFFIGLGTRLKVNIFSYDYAGYGVSESKPSERNLYNDIDMAYFVLRTRYGQNPENIILYGQSIGTVPTIDLASRYTVGAVVLHSPLTSGLRVACPETTKTFCCDSFANIDKVKNIQSAVLVIHGTDDEVVDFSHGLEIYDKSPVTLEPLWVEGAGHNDVELFGGYLERVKKLIEHDLPIIQKRIKKERNGNKGQESGDNRNK